jgi:hypothetical protein
MAPSNLPEWVCCLVSDHYADRFNRIAGTSRRDGEASFPVTFDTTGWHPVVSLIILERGVKGLSTSCLRMCDETRRSVTWNKAASVFQV